jgi:hypothetical protein
VSDLTFHPLADLFPMLDGVAFERFVEDIRANGQLQPIVIHEGQILDGRNRYRACLKLQIAPKTIPWDGKGSPLSTVLSLNLHEPVNSIENRKAIADYGCDAMINLCPSWTIDTLLTWPRKAEQVAQYVLRKLHRPSNEENVHQVLRALLSSRKRGDLKRDRH